MMDSRERVFTAVELKEVDRPPYLQRLHRILLEETGTGIELMRSKQVCRILVYPNGLPQET